MFVFNLKIPPREPVSIEEETSTVHAAALSELARELGALLADRIMEESVQPIARILETEP